MQVMLIHSSRYQRSPCRRKPCSQLPIDTVDSITKRHCRKSISLVQPLICKEVKYVTLASQPSSPLAQGRSTLNRDVPLVQRSRNLFFFFNCTFFMDTSFFSSQLNLDGYEHCQRGLLKKKGGTPILGRFKYIFLFIRQDLAKPSHGFHLLIIQSANAAFHILEKNMYMLLINLAFFLSGTFCTAIQQLECWISFPGPLGYNPQQFLVSSFSYQLSKK